jgi:hypothetical protein
MKTRKQRTSKTQARWKPMQQPSYGSSSVLKWAESSPKLGATPCPVRVLPQDLSADCYARYSVHLSSTEFSASQARIRMHCHEGMHLFNSRELYWSSQRETTYAAPWEEHAHFPLPSELYRVRFAHGTPTALFMARQNTYVIINGTCSYRSEGDAPEMVLKIPTSNH